ncbi:hypothetical protein N9M66_01225 [Litoreibacter sp.]|nr:hypothetical protein [Litoreibacter sp.]
MKTVIASALVALSFAAPAVADTSAAQAFFALGNDSAAERFVGKTSQGDIYAAQLIGAAANDSASERKVFAEADIATRNSSLLSFFALSNDSAAERLAK